MALRYYFSILFIPLCLFGQQKKKIDSLNKLFNEVQNKDLNKAFEFAKQAFELSEKEEIDNVKLISYKNYIEILYKLRKIEIAEGVNEKMRGLAQKLNNTKHLSLYYYYSSNLNAIKRNYDKSLIAIEKALEIAKHNNFVNIEHKAFNGKVSLLRDTKNQKKALSLVKSVLENKSYKDFNDLAMSYSFLGGLHFKYLKQKDSSVYFYKKTIDLIDKTDNEYLKTVLYFNYGDLLLQTDNRQEGLSYLNLAKDIAVKSHNYRFLYYVTSSLGIYYHDNEEYAKAVEKYKEAEEKYGKHTRKESIAHLYWMLSEALYLNNQPKEAYLYQEKLLLLKDSLFTTEKNKTFEKLQTEYEVEKKNDQIAFLEKEQALEAKQKKLGLGIGGLLVTVLGLLVFVYRNKVSSEKLIREKEQQLFQQEKAQLEQDQKIKRIEGYIEGEEKEKNRIAMELHDGIGGQLSGIKHYIASLPKNDETEVILKNVGSVSQEVRLLSHSLSTSFSMRQPFVNLLQTLKEQYQNHFKIEFSIFPEEKMDQLPKEQRLFLHRSIQEMLNNTYKYAHAKTVSINLTVMDEVVLMVEDDGKGFSVNNTPKGIGLQNIQDKLQTWNGNFEIDSTIGKGTTVVLKIPA